MELLFDMRKAWCKQFLHKETRRFRGGGASPFMATNCAQGFFFKSKGVLSGDNPIVGTVAEELRKTPAHKSWVSKWVKVFFQRAHIIKQNFDFYNWSIPVDMFHVIVTG
ncbi:Aldo_ket_red domain-containing protein [Raphanus sativus]|nr:Aldo_ket_red domain-containing protein [Raphanus sativus]